MPHSLLPPPALTPHPTPACTTRPPLSPFAAARFVFHMAPFNSVDHLHLHCLLPPFTSTIQEYTYTPGSSWCSSAGQVMASL